MKHLFVKCLCPALVAGTLAMSAHAKASQPNVVMILVDDLKPTIGAYGDTHAVTPNIDRLANMGMRFNNAYCNQAVCMASRYNLMLGSRSTSTGLYQFGTEFRDEYPDAVTLPQYFKNAGYHVEGMGKVFHIGHGNTNDEASWSVPHIKEKVIEYLSPDSTGGELTREEAFFENTRMFFPDLPPNKQLPRGAAWESLDVLDEAYGDGRVARLAIDRLRDNSKHADRPFFMAIGFARPHLPFCVPKKYWDMHDPASLPMPEYRENPVGTPAWAVKKKGEIDQFEPIPEGAGNYDLSLVRKLIHGYYASTSYVDAQIGRVVDEMERLGLLENTIIVLWGDHGWHLGDHGSWTKHSNFEQATRIPLIIVAPGVVEGGSDAEQMAETVDVYPTLVELAGLPRPETSQPMDGLSMKPVLLDPETSIRDHAYHSFPRFGGRKIGCAIRTERYRMVEWVDVSGAGEASVFELYDYQEDPLETRNHAVDKPEVVRELQAILKTHPAPTKPLGMG